MYDDLNADKKYYSCCLFLDLLNAFDTVDHNVLLRTMSDQFEIKRLANNFLKVICQTAFSTCVQTTLGQKCKKYLWGSSRVEPRPAIVLDVHK